MLLLGEFMFIYEKIKIGAASYCIVAVLLLLFPLMLFKNMSYLLFIANASDFCLLIVSDFIDVFCEFINSNRTKPNEQPPTS